MRKTLVIGAAGQIGTDLTLELQNRYGKDLVVASDIREPSWLDDNTDFEELDVMDKEALLNVVRKHDVSEIYNLAALLSATAEMKPKFAWELNMNGLLNVLELARERYVNKVFWPSSIAVFGPTTPKRETPQHTIMEPNTVYGISKLAGERWCDYYYHKFDVDVRSVRYPGLISYRAEPGGGTTDYAVNIFHEAIRNEFYECFLSEDTMLPMMYMPDAIEATIGIMDADPDEVKERSSYNITGFSFSPKEIAEEIKNHIPDFSIRYSPDYRQQLASSWPESIDDSIARQDWGWREKFSLQDMVADMLEQLEFSIKRETS